MDANVSNSRQCNAINGGGAPETMSAGVSDRRFVSKVGRSTGTERGVLSC